MNIVMHNEIKTYDLNTPKGDQIDFILKKIEYIYDHFNGIIDTPHRHAYFTLLLVKEGFGRHIIDFKKFEVQPKSLHLIYPGQVHQFITHKRPNGWVMNFSASFLLQNTISNELINQVYLYNTFGDSPPIKLFDDEFLLLEDIVKQIESYTKRSFTYKYDALGALLKLFFINTTSLRSITKNNELNNATGIHPLFSNFKKVIESHFKSTHKVADYADMLAVTSDHLNKYTKALTGKSAKEFIQERIILESKRILLFTEESNKEIAYALGFEEPAHFSNFFKKHTHITPGKFRLQSRSLTD
jgi:AraC-like DNA-binding protein